MGVRKKDFDSVKGFSDIRQYGEDLDLSYKLIFSGKKSALISDAKVFHKRRADIFNFFNQMFKSGKGRHYLNLKYKNTFKLFHLLPSLFLLGFILGILLFAFNYFKYSNIILGLYMIYSLLIFIFSTIINKNPIIGFLSVVTTFCQFFGYGAGFIYALVKK
tara:strand:- start:29 stop:511 length:483 start_codon:yes stop_codon:yes gene_type:complete